MTDDTKEPIKNIIAKMKCCATRLETLFVRRKDDEDNSIVMETLSEVHSTISSIYSDIAVLVRRQIFHK